MITEKEKEKRDVDEMSEDYESKNRSNEKRERDELSPISKESSIGFILIFSAGWINIQGIKLGILDSLSYVTGRGVRIGMSIFEGDITALFYAFASVLSYVTGAYIGAKITVRRRIGAALFVTSFFLSFVSFTAILQDCGWIFDCPYCSREVILTVSMIFTLTAMGSMNAATSMTLIGRTTHLTGTTTDIGISLALGKTKTAMFHALRWVGFFMGAFVAMCFYGLKRDSSALLTIVPVFLIFVEAAVLSIKKKRITVNSRI